MAELSDTDQAILELEGRFWRYAGAKEQAIRDELDMGAIAYYRRLNELLDNQAAAEHAPLLVARLRRLRALRTGQRSARRAS